MKASKIPQNKSKNNNNVKRLYPLSSDIIGM